MQFPQPMPYLHFKDQSAAALNFYQQVFGGQVQVMTYADMPADAMAEAAEAAKAAPPQGDGSGCGQMSDADRNLALHANLMGGDITLMASDTPSSMPFKPMQGISLSFSCDDVAKARRVFEQLAQGGQVTMPLGETFWVELFGMATDRFGVAWMVNGGKPKMTPSA